MVKQYPHYLFALITGESTQGEDGRWSDEDQQTIFLSMCREETDGRGSEIQTADGTYRKYSAIIQIPKGALTIDEGTSVFVSNHEDGSDVRIKGVALKFDKGQLHSRLWV
ncbi:hypothetical protein HMPREF1981_02004 [Bacteroides pyogenes F0041]|uniref:Uncharacterized protein n=2 Tax=Bacteroides pyogenes TaxID=310300 RepID=U2DU06_9BACE|nr:hypothetical protein HMPREF1981_02004 [Bacteroides pyogenes F0041]